MTKTFLLAALCSAVATCALGRTDATSAPESGTFAASVFVEKASGSCLDAQGYGYPAILNFGGLSSVNNYIKIPIATFAGEAMVSVQTLTTTTGKGTTNQAGTFVWVGNGIGEKAWNVSGTFTESITEITTHAFAMKLTDTYGSCTETIDVALVRTGVNQ